MQGSDGIALCRLEDIPDRAGRGFTVQRDGRSHDVFVVRNGAAAHAYHNACPHKGLNLDWRKEQFMDAEGEYIHC